MTKILLCIALLAMTYPISADVPAYALPLTNDTYAQENITYLVNSCQTTDGKFYYLDSSVDSTNTFLQEWDSTNQTSGTAFNVSHVNDSVQGFIKTLGDDVDTYTTVKCVGTGVYYAVYYRAQKDYGLQLFLIDSSFFVKTYKLDLNSSYSQDKSMALTTSTADGKFCYLDTDSNQKPILQIWDSEVGLNLQPIDMTNSNNQLTNFQVSLGAKATYSFFIQAIGHSVYYSLPYSTPDQTGVQLFLIMAADGAPTYSLPLKQSLYLKSDQYLYLRNTCVTQDGKLYYLDVDDDNSTPVLHIWDSNKEDTGADTKITGIQNQAQLFITNIGADAETTTLVSCIGDDIYYNVAWNLDTDTGIELFYATKGASILSISSLVLVSIIVSLLL